MIAVGLDWRMAIGACVLGNTIMGLVITINGRMGAIVGLPESHCRTKLTLDSSTLPFPCSPACLLATTLHSLSSCLAVSWLSCG